MASECVGIIKAMIEVLNQLPLSWEEFLGDDLSDRIYKYMKENDDPKRRWEWAREND